MIGKSHERTCIHLEPAKEFNLTWTSNKKFARKIRGFHEKSLNRAPHQNVAFSVSDFTERLRQTNELRNSERLPSVDNKRKQFVNCIADTRNSHLKRLLAGGQNALFESELLELLMSQVMDSNQAEPLALKLLSKFGDLNGVLAASEQCISRIPGATPQVYLQFRMIEAFAGRMGQAKILNRVVMSCWSDLISYCRTSMACRHTEQFRVFFLDRKNAIIADEELGTGTVDHVPVYPREVAKRALEHYASALILVHNHPSGDTSPSLEDIEMTRKISAACEAIGVAIHDHVVIGKGTETSFRAEGYFNGDFIASSLGTGVGVPMF